MVILLFGILLIYTVTFSMLANSGQIFFFLSGSEYSGHQVAQDKN